MWMTSKGLVGLMQPVVVIDTKDWKQTTMISLLTYAHKFDHISTQHKHESSEGLFFTTNPEPAQHIHSTTQTRISSRTLQSHKVT